MAFSDAFHVCPKPADGAVLTGDGWRITILTDRLFRLEYEPDNHFREGASTLAINRDFPVPEYTVTETENLLTIETESVRLKYDHKPFSGDGLFAVLKGSYLPHMSIWRYGESMRNLKGTGRTLDGADGAIPLEEGFASLEGFAALSDRNSMGIDEEGCLTPAAPHGEDLYLFAYGWDFKAAVRDFYHLSGTTPLLPRFALGNWWSRYYQYTEESYKALMTRFAEEQIPLSVAVIDMDWHLVDIDRKYGTGWTGYTWNRDFFPDPEGMIAWLHDRNLKVTMNDHPADGIRSYEELYPAMCKEMGIDPESGDPVDFDASSERFLQAFEKVVLDTFERQGLDFWWIDWQQRGGTTIPGVDPLFVLNHTRWLYANRKPEQARGITFSRYGGPGSHRYPVGFSGDTCITWDSLAFQPYFTATAANIGYGWWSHDIGGHMQGIKDETLTVRWVQFGVFSPIMRLHSTNNIFLGKEPWNFSRDARAIMERYLRMRHQLCPWLYTQMVETREEGLPILYPVYYDWPCFDSFETMHQEYMLGKQMLVAPIVTPQNPKTKLGSTNVWLPEGTWVDFFRGTRYSGGRRLTVYRTLEEIPVFVRPGTIVPMDGSSVLQNGCPLPEVICFRIFAGASGQYTLTEDNGLLPDSSDYRQCRTTCRYEEDEAGSHITIEQPEGAAELLPGGRRYVIELVGVLNGDVAECSHSYDEETRTIRIESPEKKEVYIWTLGPETALTAPSPSERKERLYRFLYPIEMENNVKEKMLRICESVEAPADRLAAYFSFLLPEGLMGALTEFETAYA